MTSRPEDLNFGEEQWTWRTWTDGTLTSTELSLSDGVVLGEGEARRLKGDRRNTPLGVALASARACEAAAAYFYELAGKEGYTQAFLLHFTEEEAALIKDALREFAKYTAPLKP